MTTLNRFQVTIQSDRILTQLERDWMTRKMREALTQLMLGDELIGVSLAGQDLLHGAFTDVQISVRADVISEPKIKQAQRDYLAFRADGWEHESAMMLACQAAQLSDDEHTEFAKRTS